MKRLLSKIFSRMAITILLLLIQIGYILILFLQIMDASYLLTGFFTLLSLAIALFIINKDINPSYKIAWLALIGVVPLLGGLLYLFLGTKRPKQKIRKKLAAEHAQILGILEQNPEIPPKIPERTRGTAQYIWKQAEYPIWENTSAEYYPLGDIAFPIMLQEMEKAKKFIFLEYFIIDKGYMWDTIMELLKRKAAEGVDVRLIYDDMGSLDRVPAHYPEELKQYGIRAMAFNPFVPLMSIAMNNRDHRKILVIDGHTAFSGGINLADEYINRTAPYGHWKDTAFMLRGDAVWNYTEMFLEMWNAFQKTDASFDSYRPPKDLRVQNAQGFFQPYSDTPLDNESLGENVYLEILAQAKEYVYIFTPYLIIDSEMQGALCMAAKRGIDVRICTPGIPDKKLVFQITRSHYAPLLRAGVKIYEYTPGFLHAKSFVSDDHIAVVGTINMDYRSLYLHFECGCLMINAPVIEQIKQDALATYAVSHKVGREDTRQGFLGKLVTSVLRIVSPML